MECEELVNKRCCRLLKIADGLYEEIDETRLREVCQTILNKKCYIKLNHPKYKTDW